MQCPTKNSDTYSPIIPSPCSYTISLQRWGSTIVVILVTPLPAENAETFDQEIDCNGKCRCPPYRRISDQVNLTVVLAPEISSVQKGESPEIDTTSQPWPVTRTRIPGVTLHKTCVCSPHDLVQFPKLRQKSWNTIIYSLCIRRGGGMAIRFNVPIVNSIILAIYQIELGRLPPRAQVTSCCSNPHSGNYIQYQFN